MITLIGLVKWWRRRGGCPAGCKIGQVVPMDEALGLQPYQRTSLEVKWLACALAVFVPFEIASVLLGLLTGVKVCSKSIWLWVQQSGQVGILARLGERISKAGKRVPQLAQRRLVAVLGDIEVFSTRLWLESVQQGVLSSPQVVWLSDGGRGFWRLFDERFATYATGILDFYHAAQNLWKGSKAWLDGRTQPARHWFTKTRRLLRRGKVNKVMADIEAALALEGLPPSAHQSLTNLYNYLDKHRNHIDYAKFKELGLPIGSGIVESACKWLIQQRFKGVGMRWSEEGFNHLLHLRLAWVNGRFDDLFAFAVPPN
jgi:hypothetical protein